MISKHIIYNFYFPVMEEDKNYFIVWDFSIAQEHINIDGGKKKIRKESEFYFILK